MPHVQSPRRPPSPASPSDIRDAVTLAIDACASPDGYGSVQRYQDNAPSALDKHPPEALCRILRARAFLGIAPPRGGQLDWSSLFTVYFVMFVSEAARGLLLPSAWPYFRSMGGSKSMLGVFIGMLSYGRMMTTIPLGYLSDRSMKHVFYAACLVQMAGHLLYVLARSVVALVVARLIIGAGSSTNSVCQAYIARSVPSETRTVHFAYLAAIQFTAFAALPMFGDLFEKLPTTSILGLQLNGFTYPPVVLVLANAVVFAAVCFIFIDPPSPAPSTASTEPGQGEYTAIPDPEDISRANGQAPTTPRPSIDYLPMLTCALSNIALRGAIATLETVETPFLMEQYGMKFDSTGIFVTAFGVVGIVVLLFFKPLSQRFSDRLLVAFGLAATCTAALPLAIPGIARRLPVGLYATALGLIWGFGYPVGQTGAVSLFSKTTQGMPAGGLLGIYSASGSLSRVIFAIVVGILWGTFGRESVFLLLFVFGAAALALIAIVWNRLRPPRA